MDRLIPPWTVFSIVVLSLILNAPDKLNVNVYPRFVPAGGAVRLTCRVPRQAENRRLRYGLVDYVESERDLEGEHSRVTWEATISHVPCEAGDAYCAVDRSDGTTEKSVLRLIVTGCDNGADDSIETR